jgi:amino acid permease
MKGSTDPSIPLPKVVEKVGKPVSPQDVDTYGRLKEIHDHSHRTRTIVGAWKKQQTEERAMRRTYATSLLIALGVQAILVNTIYILVGCKILVFDPWTSRTFIMAVFAEIAAMVFWIVKYLFRQTGNEVLQLDLKAPKRMQRRGHEREEEDR